MILPIVPYGQSILRQKCKETDLQSPALKEFIDTMWQTLYAADGAGLAAPQVNLLIKLFVVDSTVMFNNMNEKERAQFFVDDEGIQEVFINARIVEYSDDKWVEQEGCLSIPAMFEAVERPWSITIEYVDGQFNPQIKTFTGTTARVIQHEYDHTQGKMYIDYVKPLRRKLMGSKLTKITKGLIKTKYKMLGNS
jgi:peptide deformylase